MTTVTFGTRTSEKEGLLPASKVGAAMEGLGWGLCQLDLEKAPFPAPFP